MRLHHTAFTLLSDFTNHAVIITIGICALMLVYARPVFSLFIGTVIVLACIGNLDERRMLPMYLLILSLGAREIVPCVQRLWPWGGARQALTAWFAPVALILGFLFLNVFVGQGFKKKFYGDPNRNLALGATYRGYHFHRELIDVLDQQRYILTSGWWQFPELSIRYNLHFHDRMAPQNASIPASQAALFFSTVFSQAWPQTTVEGNCASVIYREGPLVVCRPRANVPISYHPVPQAKPSASPRA
jgi:hypothetical protein